ncbi:MAG: helix-turn-helix transcriptional regulator [Clostridia bacterium]|nr:helix-turn-helix transcriptional regulator [Clostridia bacterium]
MNRFAERLKELREERKLTQYELSKKVNLSAACINRWEKSLRVPNIDSIIILCRFFGCTSDYLIGLEN